MKRILLGFLFCFIFGSLSYAQGPKWVSKVRKAVLTVTTFDKDGSLLKTGNGFFISGDGIAVSDFNLFKGAYTAVAINTEGVELPVESILGADDTYDIVKFRVNLSKVKKVQALDYYLSPLNVGDEVIVLPYSVEKSRSCLPGKIKKIDTISDDRNYLTLDFRMSETMVSCPVMNAEGEVLGILQKPYGESDGMTSHVLDIHLIDKLEVNALSSGNYALKDIYIKKSLPSTEDQALVYLYVMGAQMTPEQYQELLADYIAQYPNSIDGYLKRAQHLLSKQNNMDDVRLAEKDLEKAQTVAIDKADIAFRVARFIMANQDNKLLEGQSRWSVDEALKYIDQAIAINEAPLYFQVKAEILTVLTRYDEAIVCYEKVNNSEFASSASYYHTALVKYEQKADLSEVIALMDSCINYIQKPYNISSAPYLYQRALFLNEAGRYRDALVDMKEFYYATEGKVEASFFYEREQMAIKARLYQQALDDIMLAIQKEPTEILYHLELASINLRLGRNEEALKTINNALLLDDKNGEAYRLQGVAYIQLKDKRACDSLNKAKQYGDPLVQSLIDKHCK